MHFFLHWTKKQNIFFLLVLTLKGLIISFFQENNNLKNRANTDRMNSPVKVTAFEELNDSSLLEMNIQSPDIEKSNDIVNGSDNISQNPKIYTNFSNHQKSPESETPSLFATQEPTEKKNENYLDDDNTNDNIKFPTSSPELVKMPSESVNSSVPLKLRKVDNEEFISSKVQESDENSETWEQASALAQCTKELDEELEMIKKHWRQVFCDLENFEKSSFKILDGLIDKAEDLEKSWKMQKEEEY